MPRTWVEGGLWPRLNSYPQGRNGVSEDKDPREGSPQLLEPGCPSPRFLCPSVSPPPPALRLQADSSLPFPNQPVHLAQVSFVIPAFNSNFTLDLELNQ